MEVVPPQGTCFFESSVFGTGPSGTRSLKHSVGAAGSSEVIRLKEGIAQVVRSLAGKPEGELAIRVREIQSFGGLFPVDCSGLPEK